MIDGVISDGGIGGGNGGSLIKVGTGTLTLSGANTYSGGTTIEAGTLNLDTDGRAGSGAITIDNGARLGLIDGANALNDHIVNLSGGQIYFRESSSAGTAQIDNSGSLYFQDNSSAASAIITNNAGGTFDISGLSSIGISVGSIEGAGDIVLGSKVLTTGSNNLSTVVDGVISGTGGSLIKVGTGTLTLSNIDTYSGGTLLNGGTLDLQVLGAAGAGPITFGTGTEILQIQNAALSPLSSTLNMATGSKLPPSTTSSTWRDCPSQKMPRFHTLLAPTSCQ